MIYPKTFLLIIFSVLCIKCNAQQTSTVVNNFNIRLSPLSLIDFYNGSSYKLGFEAKLFYATSIYADFGGYFKTFNGYENFTGYNLDLGLKYYIKNKDINQGSYISINYFHKNQGFDYTDTALFKQAPEPAYRIQKNINCVNLNFGYLHAFDNRLVLDVLGGLGIRYRNATSSLPIEYYDQIIKLTDSQSLYFVLKPGNSIWMNFNVRFKIAYRIF